MKFHKLIVNQEIILRIIEKTDDEIIFKAIDTNRVFLRKWLPFVNQTQKLKHTASFVKSIVDDVERRQEVYTIWVKEEFAGLIGLKDIDYLNRKVEIGYWLIEKFTGKGIMSQSVERLTQLIFEEMEMNRIQIKCGVENLKSSAIPKRLGFHFEGIERAGERHSYRYIDLETYSLLKNEL